MGKVYLTQYKRPDGKKEQIHLTIDDEHSKKAEDMILTCEVLTTGKVAIYGRYPEEEIESEVLELAGNGQGEKSPHNMLIKVIDRVYDRKHKKEMK